MKEELPDLDRFFAEHRLVRHEESVREVLEILLRERRMTKAELSKRACVNESYLYEILSGRKRPSRDRILCLCFGLGLSLEESQEILRRCGYEKLFPKRKRDALLCRCLENGWDVLRTNEALFDENMQTLY